MKSKIIISEAQYTKLFENVESQVEYKTNVNLAKQQRLKFLDKVEPEMGRFISSIEYISTQNKRIKAMKPINFNSVENIMAQIQNGHEIMPILLDWDWSVLDGENRLEAAKKLKIKQIPVMFYHWPEMES